MALEEEALEEEADWVLAAEEEMATAEGGDEEMGKGEAMERAGAMVQVVADSVVEVEVEVLMEEEKEVGEDEAALEEETVQVVPAMVVGAAEA